MKLDDHFDKFGKPLKSDIELFIEERDELNTRVKELEEEIENNPHRYALFEAIEEIRELKEALKRCRQGYYNIIEFDVHPDRESLEYEIDLINKVLSEN